MSAEGFPTPLAITRVTPLTPYGYFVQWSLRNDRLSGTYVFRVYRGGSTNGPWERVSDDLTNQYAFIDRLAAPVDADAAYRRPNQLALARRFFYRVVATLPDGTTTETIDDTDPDLTPLQAQVWRRATYDFGLSMSRFGVPIAVLKRRRWGVRCLRCTDAKTREIVRAGCVACWGTGFTEGYWKPMLVRGRRAPGQENTTTAPEQKSDGSVTRILLPYTPQVEQDDLLIFTKDNKRYVCDKQIPTEVGTVTVHQGVAAIELNHDHILYRFPVDVNDVRPLV